MDNTNIPTHLYRGVKIDYDDIDSFEFTGVDLSVNYEPIIDSEGRKTVLDGNEYGVYMTDNLKMVKDAYGNLHNAGTNIAGNISVANKIIKLPAIAIIYDINTDGLNIRHPFITDYLKGHYNNGYQGNEWICDVVPKDNYKLYRVRIGADVLHDVEDIELSNPNDIKKIVKKKIEERKKRLELFAGTIKNIPLYKRNWYGREEMNIFKMIYGKNGLKYINEEALITDDVEGMLKYMMAKVVKDNKENIDFKVIKYIDGLKGKTNNVNDIIRLLEIDRENEFEKKQSHKNDKNYNISSKNTLIEMLDRLILIVKNRIKDKKNILDNQDDVIESWEKIKNIYNYDSLDEEKKRIIENEYQRMIYKKRLEDIKKVDEGRCFK